MDMETTWIKVCDDEGDSVWLRPSEITEVTSWGVVYTRLGHKYFYHCSSDEFIHSL